MSALLYAAIGLLGLYLLLRSRSREKKGKPIPGPQGWPLVGSAFSLTQETIHETFTQYARQYGDIFRVNVFGSTFVVLNSAELTRKAFNTDPYKMFMNDRSKTFYGEKILFGSQSIAFTQNAFGSVHGDLRKGFTRAMHVYGEGRQAFEDKVKTQFARLIEDIESYNGKEFDIQDLIKRSLTNMIAIVFGGHDVKDEEESLRMFWEFDRANDFLLNAKVDSLLRTFPFIRFIPSIYKQRYDEIVNAKVAITRKYFHEIKATHEPGVIGGLVDFLIDEQLQAKERGGDVLFTDEKIIAMVLESITAGVLTTLGTTCSLFLCLLNHPEYQTKIQKELDRVVGGDRQPAFADKKNCPVIEAVAMESQRLMSVLPLLVAHLCQSSIEFEGYDIPANSTIIPNIWYIHHDEKVWGDPWTFRPERFLDDNGEILPNDHPLRKRYAFSYPVAVGENMSNRSYGQTVQTLIRQLLQELSDLGLHYLQKSSICVYMSWLPFGTGRRQCIGESFARSRVFLFVATLLHRWTFEMSPEHHAPCDPRRGHFKFAVTCRPKHYLCKVVPRV